MNVKKETVPKKTSTDAESVAPSSMASRPPAPSQETVPKETSADAESAAPASMASGPPAPSQSPCARLPGPGHN